VRNQFIEYRWKFCERCYASYTYKSARLIKAYAFPIDISKPKFFISLFTQPGLMELEKGSKKANAFRLGFYH